MWNPRPFTIAFAAHFAAVGILVAGQLGGWEWVDPSPQGFHLFAVSSGNGSVVAVGENGVVVESHDGVNFEVVVPNQPGLALNGALMDVTWAGDQFIAVGQEQILTSPDGRFWSQRLTPVLRTLYGIVWTGDEALAVGDFAFYTSADGEQWVQHQFGVMPYAVMRDVAWDGTRYVAVGYDDGSGDSVVLVSDDGRTWQEAPVSGVPPFGYMSIANGNGVFVVVGGIWAGGPHLMVSEDGLSWTPVVVDTTGAFLDITYVDGRFIATGWDGLFATSPDGFVWEFHREETGTSLAGTAEQHGTFYVVGEFGMITTTEDGFDWQKVSKRSFHIGYDPISDIARSESGIYVAVGVRNRGWSEDGTNWFVNGGDEIFNTVRWAEGAFWSTVTDFTTNGHISTSSDGEHWEVVSGGSFHEYVEFNDVAVNEVAVVAVGSTRGKARQAVIATKYNDDDWISQSFPDRGSKFSSVVWTGERFLAGTFAEDGILLASFDGLNWFPQKIGLPMRISWFESDGERTVGIGLIGNTGAIVSSLDGSTWVRSFWQEPEALSDVTWTGEHFVAVGSNGTILTSNDGVAWTRDKVGFGTSMNCVAGDRSEIFAGGWSGSIFRASFNSLNPRLGANRAASEGPFPVISIRPPVD